MSVAITNKVASDRAISIWVVPEDVKGVLKEPTAEHRVEGYDVTYPKQIPEYENSKERAQTRDVLDRCQGQMPAGDWEFTTSCRPDGLGVAPAERDLMTALVGTETINSGVDVLYTLALEKTSVSIWFLIDHTMVFCSGATVGGLTVSMEDCPIELKWKGQFMAMGVTGTDEIATTVDPAAVEVYVSNADKYTIGGFIVLADATGAIVDDNAGAGYEVLAVDYDLDKLTTPAITTGVASGGFAAPLDVGGTVLGNKLDSRTATVEIDTIAKSVIDFNIEVADQPEYLDRERTPSGYPEDYSEVQREVTGTLTLSFRRDDAEYIKDAISGDEKTITFKVGELEGYQLEIPMPRCVLEVPEIEEDTPIVHLNINYQALAVTGEDSYSVKYL